MAFFEPQPVTAATSIAKTVNSNVRVSNPFVASNLTWTEMIASTSQDWGGFQLTLGSSQGNGIAFVAIGAAASEVIIASVPIMTEYRKNTNIYIPIPIPAGTRVSVATSQNSAYTVYAQIIGYAASGFDSIPAFTVLESGPYCLDSVFADYGKSITSLVDPGAVANTKGAYQEISETGNNGTNNILNGSSLAQTYDWFGVMVGDNTYTASVDNSRLWDIATGAASSEVIFMADLWDRVTGSETRAADKIHWTPEGMAAGTRISARMQCDITDAGSRLGNVYLFGLR